MTNKLFYSIAVGAFAVTTIPLGAQSTFGTTINMYGAPGLIDMPTAEMMPDAELSMTTSTFAKAQKTTISFQILPRMTGSFRYTKIKDIFAPTGVLGGDTFDRSFDIAYQVLTKDKHLIDVTVGLRDFMGTGLYAGEYIVATTSLGPNLKVTGGAGWGRLSNSNTLHTNSTATGGTPNASSWFRGPVGYFAGLEWQTPIKPATFKIEYSADQYALETRTTARTAGLPPLFDRKSQINFGLDYKVGKRSSIGLYYMHGSELGLKLNTNINPNNLGIKAVTGPAPTPIIRRSDDASYDTSWENISGINKAFQTALDATLKPQGIRVDGLAMHGTHAELRIRNQRYQAPAQAIGRAARAMTNLMPASVETIVITPMEGGIPAVSVKLDRSALEDSEFNLNGSEEILENARIYGAVPSPAGLQNSDAYYPHFSWALKPYVGVSLFDPAEPVRAELGLRLQGTYTVRPGLSFSGSVIKEVVGNNGQGTISPSNLPKVRSESSIYNERGDPAIEHLKADYLFKPHSNLYGRISGGYLESHFGGISAELLWKPTNQNWGIGAEINYVKQREFEQLFGFRPYSVATGHISGYYDFNNGFSTQVDLGRYLAGDVGGTLSVNRRFLNGWEVGAYVTLTNVSSADFGEGSFDKGIRVTVPLKTLIGTQTRTTGSTTLSSLTRDGGARLEIPNRLHPIVRDLHQKNLAAGWGGFLR